MIRGQEGPPLPSGEPNTELEKVRSTPKMGEAGLGPENPLDQPLQNTQVLSPSPVQTIFALNAQPELSQSRILVSRDFKRWPETRGFPPICGGSGKDTKSDKGRCLTVQEAAELLGVTQGRIRGMVAAGQLPAEKRKVIEKLFIPYDAVATYKDNPIRKHAPKHRKSGLRDKSELKHGA